MINLSFMKMHVCHFIPPDSQQHYLLEFNLPSSLLYKWHLSRQINCWSLRCSWSIACRCCSNYIFILNLLPGFIGLGKDNCKMRWESFKFWDLVRLLLEILWFLSKWFLDDTWSSIWMLVFMTKNWYACESIFIAIQKYAGSRNGTQIIFSKMMTSRESKT